MNNILDIIMCIGSVIYFLLWIISTFVDLKLGKKDLGNLIFIIGAGIFCICGVLCIVLYIV